MKNVILCRRTFICFMALASMLTMALAKGMDTSATMAAVAIALAGANATEGAMKAKFQR